MCTFIHTGTVPDYNAPVTTTLQKQKCSSDLRLATRRSPVRHVSRTKLVCVCVCVCVAVELGEARSSENSRCLSWENERGRKGEIERKRKKDTARPSVTANLLYEISYVGAKHRERAREKSRVFICISARLKKKCSHIYCKFPPERSSK